MVDNWRRFVIWICAGLVAGGLTTAAVQKALAREGTGKSVPVVVDKSPPAREGRGLSSYSAVVKKAAPAVVNIFTTKTVRNPYGQGWMPFFDEPMFRRFFGEPFGGGRSPGGPRSFTQRSLGSGVLVSKDGYLLTNNHVVDGADEIQVAREKAHKQYTAKVVGRDPQTDLAVLKVEADDLPFVTFADSDLVEVGDVVLAIGNPFGVGQTVTQGIVSAVDRGGMGIEDYEDFIQTDAAINPGNSGGALVDAQGRLIGVNTAILSGTGGNHGVGFAIPANLIRTVMDQLIQNGSVDRGYLGVGIQDLTPDLAKEFELDSQRGVLVTEVNEDTAAAEAGLQRGDVIVELNGKPVDSARTLRLQIGHTRPNTVVSLKLVRGGKEKTLKVTLKSMPSDFRTSTRDNDEETTGNDEGALRGVGVGDVTPAVRQRFRIPSSVSGAVVTQVDPDSAAFKAGLREGDVIQEINRKPVRNAEEAVDACKASRDGRTLVNLWRQEGHRYVVVNEKTK